MITLYLVRHGETEENVAQILQGHMPGTLTHKGIEQARDLRDRLADVAFDAIMSSDLKRARDTADIINERHDLPLKLTLYLRERDWGSFTGMHIRKARETEFPSDVEPIDHLFARMEQFLTLLIREHPGQTVLAVGHGLSNRCLEALLAGKEIRDIPRIGNAEVRIHHIDESFLTTSGRRSPCGEDPKASAD